MVAHALCWQAAALLLPSLKFTALFRTLLQRQGAMDAQCAAVAAQGAASAEGPSR